MSARARPRAPAPWLCASVGVSALVVIPVAVVASSAFRDSGGVWTHLARTRLPEYVTNTLVLAAAVGLLACFIGVLTAWFVSMHRFPGRNLFAWALMLPIAVPGYIAAYAMTDLLQFSGPVQTALRRITGLGGGEYWFPNVRSLPGAAIILAFSLFPYVYFASRIAFATLPRSAIEASRTLGRGPISTFIHITLPLSRPMIVAGLALVLMETIAEFGAVEYCSVDTLATGIYRTWFGLDSRIAASQLASVALLLVAILFVLEMASRRRAAVHATTARCVPPTPTRLPAAAGWLVCALCLVPILIGFALPAGRLAYLAVAHGDRRASELFAGYALNTFSLAAASGIAAIILALLVVFTSRLARTHLARLVMDVCRAGYALPGPLIAIGLLIALTGVDHALNAAWRSATGGPGPGLLLSGTVVAMLIGYQTRFLSVAVALIESGMSRINRRLDDAARTLGVTPLGTLLRVHVPLLRGTLLAAGLLVFVDVVKELPATLMLRPFDFETLAVRVYQLASDERLYEASTGALAIVAVGIIPVILLSRFIDAQAHPQHPGST